MALPGVNLTVLDGNLSLQAPNASRTMLFLGVCTSGTPATLYSFGDSTTMTNTLGLGKLPEAAAYLLAEAGGPVLCMPLNPSQQGGVSSVTHNGTGTGTVTLTMAPHQSITITCTTAGALGTAAFTFQLGTGAVSAPVTSSASWSSTGYRVPGTYCTIVFVAGSYISGGSADIYIISTLGVVTHPQGAGPAVPTFTASPLDDWNAIVTIGTAGALGTATFTYSLDNGETLLNGAGITSSIVVTPGGGAYAIPNTGVVLTFAGTFTAKDTYAFEAASASFSNSDLTAALTALETTYLSTSYAMATVVDGNANGAGWSTMASSLETAAGTLFNNGLYVRFLTQVPTIGSISASGAAVVVDSTDTDTSLGTTAQAVTDPHVCGAAGDLAMVSPLTGLTQRRNCSWVAAARAMAIEASRNIGDVSLGGLPGVVFLYRDENATPALDAARFITCRTIPNYPGFYLTDGHTFALSTSDYAPLTNARVIDRACTTARTNALPLVNSKIPTKTDGSGSITEKKAQQIEAKLDSALDTTLVSASPQDAVAATAQVNRTHNILSDGQLILTVAVQPYAYARTVSVNIGLSTSA